MRAIVNAKLTFGVVLMARTLDIRRGVEPRYCAALASMLDTGFPDAVKVSTPVSSSTSRHPLRCARSSSPAKSATERLTRSNFAATSASRPRRRAGPEPR